MNTAHNPFLQVAPVAPKVRPKTAARKYERSIDPDLLEIGNDEFPGARTSPEGKYSALFSKMRSGQCIKCEPKETQPLGHALRTWLKRNGKDEKFIVRTVNNFPQDGRGRVWMLPK